MCIVTVKPLLKRAPSVPVYLGLEPGSEARTLAHARRLARRRRQGPCQGLSGPARGQTVQTQA